MGGRGVLKNNLEMLLDFLFSFMKNEHTSPHIGITLKMEFKTYPYTGLILQGKNAIVVTNWDAEGDSFSLSFSRYDTAVQTNDLKPWFNQNKITNLGWRTNIQRTQESICKHHKGVKSSLRCQVIIQSPLNPTERYPKKLFPNRVKNFSYI